MKSIFIDDQHEYDLKTDGLYFAENESWGSEYRGMLAMGIDVVDDGIIFNLGYKEVALDYTEAEQVLILLKLHLDCRKIEIAERREI